MMLRIYDVALDVARQLRPLIEGIARHDVDLARQMRRALASVPLNIAEGSCSRGLNQAARYQTAAGSMREVGAGLDVAVALGYIPEPPRALRESGGRIVGTLMRIVRR